MLPSQVGSAPSGNGSGSGRGTTGHGSGAVGGGIRPVLIRAGQALPGVSESAGSAGRQAERDAAGMLGANGPGGPRGARPGNGAGIAALQSAGPGGMVGLNTGLMLPHAARFDPDRESAPLCSGSDNDSDSGDDDDPVGSLGDNRRGVKRERGEMESAVTGQDMGGPPGGYSMVSGGVAGAKPGKKTRGRVKIKMEFIDNKLRRYTTFSKRKTGIMKKERSLQELKPTFTVASLPGTTSSAQSTVPTTSTTMQVSSGPSFPITNYLAPVSASSNISANGTVLKSAGASAGVMQLPSGFTFMPGGTPLPPGTPTITLSQLQQHSLALQGQHGQALATAPQPQQGQQAVFRFPAAVSLTGAGVPQQLQAIQVHPNTQSPSNNDSSPEISHTSTNSTATVSLPATIVTSSVPTSVAGHMMYPSPHTLMYASTPALADGSLAVLNAFSQGTSAMQVSHAQAQDTGAVPQVFLTAPPGTVQIPVSAVQLHPMVIGQQSSGSSNLTELQVVNLDAAQSSKSD
ncbi:serum response factor b isoform X4 [Betta splendens]|uniref:Serum response factor b isoform X4 n=1 Tax=Betta splendens TaxID=158456 RepID=A0A9W2XAM2_BETSP|nr:serum response factor b isoform X4 [Betta splendens]